MFQLHVVFIKFDWYFGVLPAQRFKLTLEDRNIDRRVKNVHNQARHAKRSAKEFQFLLYYYAGRPWGCVC